MTPKSMLLPFAFAVLVLGGPAFGQSRPSDPELAQIAARRRACDRHSPWCHQRGYGRHRPAQPRQYRQAAPAQRKGEEAAKALGDAFKSIGVPVGQVYTSRFNRAYQTAKLAGFDKIEKSIDITEGGLVVSPNENNRRAAAFRKLASTMPPAGSNIVIVTHKPNIIDAFGKDWFEVKEGEASIFKPDGSGYKLVARVQMDEWSRIAAAAKK